MADRYFNNLSKAGAPISGVAQVETATVVGTISGSGDAAVVLTAAGMTGSPITLNVAVLNGDTAAQVAAKIRTALAANAVIAAFFSIGGAGAAIVLTRTSAAANDATLNVSIDNGTCAGLTTAATSANTTAGVLGDFHGAAAGQHVIDTSNNVIYYNAGTRKVQTWAALPDE